MLASDDGSMDRREVAGIGMRLDGSAHRLHGPSVPVPATRSSLPTHILQQLKHHILQMLADIRKLRIHMPAQMHLRPAALARSPPEEFRAVLDGARDVEPGEDDADVWVARVETVAVEVVREGDVVLSEDAARDAGDEHAFHEGVEGVGGHVGGGEGEAEGEEGDDGSTVGGLALRREGKGRRRTN